MKRKRTSDALKIVVATAIIAAQVLGIGLGRASNESFWSWMPHDRVVEYELQVSLDGVVLDGPEVVDRYGLGSSGRRADNVEDITAIVRARETRRPGDQAVVVMTYSVNGGDREVWRWPAD